MNRPYIISATQLTAQQTDSTTCVNARQTLVTESQHHEMIVQVITVRLIQTQNHGNLRPADGAPTVGGEIWCSFLSTHAFLLGNGQTYATRGVPYYRVSCIFMSRIFHPCKLVPQIHVSHFPPLWHGTAFSCPAISCLAFSASPCIRGTSHGPVCVCLSVRLSQVGVLLKRLKVGSHKQLSPGTLVFWCQRSPRNSTGVTP